ncbi:MAG TPA: ribonuclease HII [Thermotogota bacterium]|nr:ribonuclease HII [Thermotogota bacterium]HPR95032.1 ribonuclease HII [Thermotogota bacterium]
MEQSIDTDFKKTYRRLIGVDEAGRGPLAGPVVAAAVSLSETDEKNILTDLPFLTDSKKLSEKKRELIYEYVLKNKIRFGTGISDEAVIDKYNILNATNMAMNEAVDDLKVTFDMALVDGKNLKLIFPNRQIVRGDSLSLRIALASNIAKVTRDRIMYKYAEVYPEYGFEHHKGYGTKKHIEALKQHGPLPLHRITFRPVYEFTEEGSLIVWGKEGKMDENRILSILRKIQNAK